MRRDSNDKHWQEVKAKVRERDVTDRIMKAVTPSEFMVLRQNAGSRLGILDPAHYLPVSKRPDLCYKSYNIVLLNRYSHNNLDGGRSPITGEQISAEEVQKWWIRILKTDKVQYGYLESKGLV